MLDDRSERNSRVCRLSYLGALSRTACLVCVAPLILALGTVCRAAPEAVCLEWAENAAREADVPIALMKAIATVESGQNVNGELMPWPWTINFQGRGIWLGDRDEARNRIEVLTRLGSRNIDVGCFQLNLKWHGQNFSSVEAMLEPANNARYAAWFLRRLYMEFGSWEGAAKAFHSRTPRLSERYRNKLAPVLARFGGRFDNVAASTERVTFREHSTPDVEDGQVQSARPRAIASLVPYDFHGGAGPLVGLGK